ncbi:MAG: sulfate adenylyltransferase [Hyphomicrobiales bacterium]|nr:sulfate adenylyltransferase [Hyphomicrobiales bacterium]MCP5000983.1 sulfate adenylyltransferase [Hyphomicrobiales bacterium]
MSQLVTPHGANALHVLLVPPQQRASDLARARCLKTVPMQSREVSDLLMLGMGAYTPLEGFMGQDDWRSCCEQMRLTTGVFWPIPITLSCVQDLADSILVGEDVSLCDTQTGEILGILNVTEKYRIDRGFECERVYHTTDPAHPGVQKVMEQAEINLAGRVTVISESDYPTRYRSLYLHPDESRALFQKKGWSHVAAFQTRNPMHRSHEHLVKIAIEVTDGVFIHQVLGQLKPGDIPAEVRTRAIQAMIDNYFVPDTVVQAGYPIEMRYGGPREALLHALIRQNFGCSHLVVGRDHAGVGDYYGPYDAQNIFDQLWDGALQTKPLKIDITFYCKKCYGMATAKTCPHAEEHRISISGTDQRAMLARRDPIPPEFSRPEVVKILQDFYAGQEAAS